MILQAGIQLLRASRTLYFGTILLVASYFSFLVFHKYEPRKPLALALLLLLIPVGLSIHFVSQYGFTIQRLISSSAVASFSYWFLILLLTAIYRLSPFHPLAHYPGPFLHKLSKFQSTYVVLTGKLHVHYRELHHKYGDIVRVGPNELSYANVDGIQSIIGISGLSKASYFDDRQPREPTIGSIRDPVQHSARRRLWARALSSNSLEAYNPIICRKAQELVGELVKHAGVKPVDISRWMEFFSFDFMGAVAFSYSFDLMKEGADIHGNWESMSSSMSTLAVLAQIPWSTKLMRDYINPRGRGLALYKLSQMIVKHRMQVGSTYKDLFHFLSKEDGESDSQVKQDVLFSEGFTAILAGSDTTSTSLSHIWYCFLRNPIAFRRLREEVDHYFPDNEEPFDQRRLAEMPFLHACLNESMRLAPAVPSGSPRTTGDAPGGRMIGSHFVPEGNQIFMHTYTLQRDPRYFSPYPDEFWPDRWLVPEHRRSLEDNKPLDKEFSIIHNASAFIPFSFGPRNCVGKNLAMNEMRVIVSYVVQRFDMRAAEEYDLDDWEKNLEDVFLFRTGPLPVILTERVSN